MLILTRRIGETITLDLTVADHERKVVVKVLDIRGSTVRLGVEADSTVKVEKPKDERDPAVP